MNSLLNSNHISEPLKIYDENGIVDDQIKR